VPLLSGPLTVQLEATKATLAIGPDGGTVVVTNSKGTVFSLVVPEGALLATVDITATPVAAFGNLGFDADGVVFGPSGLSFLAAAKLTITPTTPVPVERQLMFAFDDSGAQFGAAEPQIDTPDAVIMVEHFSGYAFGNASRPSQAAFLQRQATDAAARISSQVGDVFQSERQSQLLTGESIVDLAAAFEAYGKQWEEQVIKPRLDAAKSSCAAGTLAMSTVIGYERQRALVGAGSNFTVADIYNMITQAYPVCLEEAITKCKGLKDPSVLVQFWFGVNRQVQLLGYPDIAPSDVNEAIKICTPTYTATGGGDNLTVTGTVADLTKTFTLEGTFPGASVTFAFFPDGESAGSYTYKGSGGGVDISGQGTYTIAETDGADGVLVLTGHSNGCATPGGCRENTDVITLTPS
jgi:hypothetical protein